jgi:hypothetical protein
MRGPKARTCVEVACLPTGKRILDRAILRDALPALVDKRVIARARAPAVRVVHALVTCRVAVEALTAGVREAAGARDLGPWAAIDTLPAPRAGSRLRQPGVGHPGPVGSVAGLMRNARALGRADAAGRAIAAGPAVRVDLAVSHRGAHVRQACASHCGPASLAASPSVDTAPSCGSGAGASRVPPHAATTTSVAVSRRLMLPEGARGVPQDPAEIEPLFAPKTCLIVPGMSRVAYRRPLTAAFVEVCAYWALERLCNQVATPDSEFHSRSRYGWHWREWESAIRRDPLPLALERRSVRSLLLTRRHWTHRRKCSDRTERCRARAAATRSRRVEGSHLRNSSGTSSRGSPRPSVRKMGSIASPADECGVR